MANALRRIDDLLRGAYTRREDLEQGRIGVPVRLLLLGGAGLGATYGVFMGLYAILRPEHRSVAQLVVTAAKVPALFLLTLLVTYPSLYVFSALSGSRLRSADTLRLLLAAICVNLAVLASFGPVTGFFTLSTASYPFMVVLNVALFSVAGVVGLGFLRRALDSVFEPPEEAPPPLPPLRASEVGDAGAPAPVPVRPPRPRASRPLVVFRLWIVIYALVGAQMGWILRPFIGAPGLEFTLFREREKNFFQAFFSALGQVLS